ncbi:conserved hypothetical protein [Formosa agariphila KMM 3901]|uniref:Uncharacterized protein n=1 Tax=Formosa agariphila (strain DSM 15362 / KCTC 12365 / LMG 23005 / KMM 3901 / M-2Alg 35-1) TaxID=1347342 RepID=T2KGQ7_FORAG|nr:hypothetical protein [Formosa agariphila]CDF77960.1 conserved hypothetical protein [Formosa agariphila KMM 3901]
MKKAYLILLVLVFAVSTSVEAQCAMCRAVLETSEGQGTAEGINDGIVYLMSIPYILIGGIFYVMYLKFFRTKK